MKIKTSSSHFFPPPPRQMRFSSTQLSTSKKTTWHLVISVALRHATVTPLLPCWWREVKISSSIRVHDIQCTVCIRILTLQWAPEQLWSSRVSGSCCSSSRRSSLPSTSLLVYFYLTGCPHSQHSPLQTWKVHTQQRSIMINNVIVRASSLLETCHTLLLLTRRHSVRGTGTQPEHPTLCSAHWETLGPIYNG